MLALATLAIYSLAYSLCRLYMVCNNLQGTDGLAAWVTGVGVEVGVYCTSSRIIPLGPMCNIHWGFNMVTHAYLRVHVSYLIQGTPTSGALSICSVYCGKKKLLMGCPISLWEFPD
jgi:hypothetical protein